MSPLKAERLQKILARAGFGSRRSCEELIQKGRVEVDGQRASLGEKADPARQRVTVDGRPVRPEKLVSYVLNKPRGVLSTTAEEPGRARVTDLVPAGARLYPVGRLDGDSEGLILLTNDGELAHRLTHPRFGVERLYRAEVRGHISESALRKLRRGVYLSEGKTLPPKVEVLARRPEGGVLKLTLKEGLNREVRRILAAVGLKAGRLVRIGLGPLRLGGLKPGRWRKLSGKELVSLKEAASGPGEPPPRWLKRRRRSGPQASRRAGEGRGRDRRGKKTAR